MRRNHERTLGVVRNRILVGDRCHPRSNRDHRTHPRVQALLRDRLPARWQYGLWLVLLVRMVMPVAPATSFSVFNLLDANLWNAQSVVEQGTFPPFDLSRVSIEFYSEALGAIALGSYIATLNILFALRLRRVQKSQSAVPQKMSTPHNTRRSRPSSNNAPSACAFGDTFACARQPSSRAPHSTASSDRAYYCLPA